MNYELAKQLKDAGFPMKLALPNSEFIWGGTDTNGTVYQYPTLSELVEACGDDFMGIGRTYNTEKSKDNSWEATQKTWCCDEHGENRKYGYGSTPEEAVAKLWLELNKNANNQTKKSS